MARCNELQIISNHSALRKKPQRDVTVCGTPTSAKLRDPNEWLPNCRGSTNKRNPARKPAPPFNCGPWALLILSWKSNVRQLATYASGRERSQLNWKVLHVVALSDESESYFKGTGSSSHWSDKNMWLVSFERVVEPLYRATSRYAPALMLTTIHLELSLGAAN